ncbi:MAG TPA: hypothetical protein VGN20_19445 [Mucilaginibacter sp.]|jgi:hypothetical protein
MTDDINKKILIQVEAETSQLKQNVSDLNQTLDSLLQKQKQLSDAGNENTKAFQDMAMQVKTVQTAIDNHTKAIDNNVKSLNTSNAALNTLSSSFVKLKDISGTFGSSLQEAAKGFNALKNSLSNTANEQKAADQTVAIRKTALQRVEDYARQSANKIAASTLSILTGSIKRQSDTKVAALEKDKTAELNNSSLTSSQKLAIEQKFKQQEGQIKAKAFKGEQEASIAQAVINGALAVTKVTAQSGVLAPLEVGVVIAETAAQVAKITAQKPPAYARGGLHYSSDGRGGALPGFSKTDNTNAFLRSGEGIVVSEAMQVPWARNLVSAINVGFGGRDFSIANTGRGYAIGGIFTDGGDANRYYNQPVTDQKNLANTIAYQMINNFPPVYVDVKDVNNQQNILAQTINRVNL